MIRQLLALTIAVLLGASVQAQTISADELSERLQISNATAGAVAEVLDGVEREPGFLWAAAAELNRQLSQDQIEELLSVRQTVRGERRAALHRGERPARGHFLGRLAAEVDDLSPEQRSELQALGERAMGETRALMQQAREGDVDTAEQRRQRAELHRSLMEEARAILTDEQQARVRHMLQSFQEARPAERRRAVRSMDPEQRREAMQAHREARQQALNITREQQQQLEESREVRRQHVREQRGRQDVERRQHRAARPAEGARQARDVMTEEQRTIARLHAVLSRAFMMRGKH